MKSHTFQSQIVSDIGSDSIQRIESSGIFLRATCAFKSEREIISSTRASSHHTLGGSAASPARQIPKSRAETLNARRNNVRRSVRRQTEDLDSGPFRLPITLPADGCPRAEQEIYMNRARLRFNERFAFDLARLQSSSALGGRDESRERRRMERKEEEEGEEEHSGCVSKGALYSNKVRYN